MINPFGNALAGVAWAQVRPWLYGGLAVLVALMVWRVYALGVNKGKTAMEPKIERLTKDVADREAGIAVLNAGLKKQSEAVAAAGNEARRVRAEIARIKAEKKALDSIVSELEQAKEGKNFCPVEDVNRRGWEKLQ